MIHIVDAAIEKAIEKVGANPLLGLLATDATLASGLYINREVKNLSGERIQVRWLLPTAVEVNEFVMPGILAVKAGKIEEGQELLIRAGNCLKQRGANALVLGCTEIPIALAGESLGIPLIDATDALAEKAVAWSRCYGIRNE
jgi:aspartate racemase